MKKQRTLFGILLSLVLAFTAVFGAAAQKDYIVVHTEEELSTLFNRVKAYMDDNQALIEERLGETENVVVTQAFVRAWAISEYEDATPQQIDDAYDALLNSFLFLGLNLETSERLYSDAKIADTLFQSAVQLLDQEYYDILKSMDEPAENIEYAEYLRGIAEALAEDPEAFAPEETHDWITDIYSELYMASGIKAMYHASNLPAPEEIFKNGESTMIPNPVTEYQDGSEVEALLGIKMPDLSEKFDCKSDGYTIIAEIIGEAQYVFDQGVALLRLTKERDVDISGVYGSEFYADWNIYDTAVEVYRYQTMWVATGSVKTHTDEVYTFAIDTDELDFDIFEDIVFYFIESVRNQSVEK